MNDGASDEDLRAMEGIGEIDALCAVAGLVRSRRARPAPGPPAPARPARPARMDQAGPGEPSRAGSPLRTAPNGVGWLPVPEWEDLPWLWHGFSTRRGGVSRAYCAEGAEPDLNLGFTAEDDAAAVRRNRRLLSEAVTGSTETVMVPLHQIHSGLVIVAGGEDRSARRADGVITAEAGLLLAVQTADCIPVLVADRRQRVVAAFHAGWRGTVGRIVERGVGRMRLDFGCRPADLVAAIGPGIGPCCYSVGEELLSAFESQFLYGRELFREVSDSDPVRMRYPLLFLTGRAPGHSPAALSLHLDLVEANRRQLCDAGLAGPAIAIAGGCTACRPDLFFSHRASRGHAGRMMSVIGVRPAGEPEEGRGQEDGQGAGRPPLRRRWPPRRG